MDIALSLGQTVAEVTSALAPLPWLSPAVGAICGIIQLCRNVATNRNLICQLRDRCHVMLLVFRDCGKDVPSEELQDTVLAATNILLAISKQLEIWARLRRVQMFVMQKEMSDIIQNFHLDISNCLARVELVSHFEIHQWQNQFEASQKRDHDEIIEYLSDIQNSQTITNEVLADNSSKLTAIMSMMQNGLGEPTNRGDRAHNGLQNNLYHISLRSGELLPDFNLKRGEIQRLGQFPVGGSAAMDIWEGLYLQGEKVAIKVVRAVNSDPNSLRRFMREVKIWGSIWKIDRGKHILPFYGFSQNDGPYPYMVSPWQQNGTAINYVKKNDKMVDYKALVRGIANGLSVLHSMEPPVVHGDLKGANIVIDTWGNPLLADFGLSQMVEDITGVPFTQSRGVSDSYRWFAPEVCVGQGVLSTNSDVFAFAMTVLELITHQAPYSHIKQTTEVVINSSQGVRPHKPDDRQVIARGLDDNLWYLLTQCWAADPKTRPTIQKVVLILSSFSFSA